MAQTTVNTPFGPVTVNHPKGASEEQILRFAKRKHEERVAKRAELAASYETATGVSESPVENFLAGFGKSIFDIGRGARQIGVEAANLIPGVDLDEQVRRLREKADATRELDAPLLKTGAGLTGAISGNLATTLLPAGLAAKGAQAAGLGRAASALRGFVAPTTFRSAAASGAVQGALSPVGTLESRIANIGTGAGSGLLGQAAARGISKIGQPVTRALSPRAEEAATLLRNEGVQLDVAQRTGSRALQGLRSGLRDNPLTSPGAFRFAEKQIKQFTRAVLRTVGQNSDEVTPKVLNAAFEDVGKVIDDAAINTPAFFDTTLASEIRQFMNRIPAEAGDDVINALNRNIQNIFGAVDENGFLVGEKFIPIRSSLSKLSKKTPIARDIEESLLNALERSGGNRAALKQALARFRNLRIIENSTEKGVDKFISPLRLSNTLGQIRNRALSLRGLGHPDSVRLARLAEAGREFIPEALPQSGTFPRSLLGAGLLGAGGFGGGLLAGQDVGDAATIGLGAAALPFALQRGLQSQGAAGQFLSQGLPFSTMNPTLQAILTQSAISGGVVGAR